jgi:hypothetical protein
MLPQWRRDGKHVTDRNTDKDQRLCVTGVSLTGPDLRAPVLKFPHWRKDSSTRKIVYLLLFFVVYLMRCFSDYDYISSKERVISE